MASRRPTSENSDMENANKPASSWPLKQGPKKWSKHGCDKGTLTVVNTQCWSSGWFFELLVGRGVLASQVLAGLDVSQAFMNSSSDQRFSGCYYLCQPWRKTLFSIGWERHPLMSALSAHIKVRETGRVGLKGRDTCVSLVEVGSNIFGWSVCWVWFEEGKHNISGFASSGTGRKPTFVSRRTNTFSQSS